MSRFLPLVLLLLSLAVAADARAQESASKRTFVKLTEVQELWEEEKYVEARAELEELAAANRDSSYDFALTNQYLAQTAILMGDPPAARRALETALSVSGLPQQLEADLKLFYGQVVLGDEDYDIAATMLEDWLAATQARILPTQLFYVAYANYMTARLERAQALIERAIGESSARNESWERLYYQILFDQKKFDAAEAVLYELLTLNTTNKSYWRLLANHYLQVEDSRQALAALLLGRLQQAVTDPADLKHMISLFSYIDLPERAARMLEQTLADETLPADEQALRQLGDLWLLARERDKAKQALEKAAAVAPDGRTYQLLGGIFFEDENWKEAYEMFLQALDLGGLKEPDRVQMLAGISAFRAGMTREAERALREAAKSDEYRDQARSLLRKLGGP